MVIKDLNYYMKTRKVNKGLRLKIRRYIEHMHEEEKYGFQRGEIHISKLSNCLRVKINYFF